MFVENQLAGIATAQFALQTIASIWQLTSYKYPFPAVVNDGGKYDYIVVGAGSAGSVVAARLSEDPNVTVLLLEAGGDPPIESNLPTGANFLQNSYLDWNQIHQSQVDEVNYQCLRNKRQAVSHGKMLGGGSSINLMMYMRGDPNDFNRWADITGDPSWRYENVLKYFMKSERLTDNRVLNSPLGAFHGTEGPMGVSKQYSEAATKYVNIYKEMGHDYVLDLNANGSLGFNEQMVTVAGGERQSTANGHLGGARGRENLHVSRHSLATKVLFDENKVATGVQFLNKDNETLTVYARKEVILSAGPINSPHILLLSGVGPKEHLEKFDIPVVSDLPVGQKIINHHGVFLVYKVDKLDPASAQQPPMDAGAFPFPMVTGLLALDKTQSYPDFMAATVIMNAEAFTLTFCLIVFAFDKETCQALYEDLLGREVLLGAVVNFDQSSRGHILLKSTNPLDSPDIYLVAYPNEESFERVLDYAEHFGKIVNTTHFKKVGGELATLPQCKHLDKHTREYLRCFQRCMSSSYYHYVASCAMGEVVDSKLRVYGTKNLRVIDSSAIPAITSGTTNAPTIMLGEKGADLIKEDNKSKC